MGPESPLPLPKGFSSPETYVESLLRLSTTSQLLQTLCGGVHILDFYTRSPDTYESLFPKAWREWFRGQDVMDILDFLLGDEINKDEYQSTRNPNFTGPESMWKYIVDVRTHCLVRAFDPKGGRDNLHKLERQIAVGMKAKKVHEVTEFAQYISRLSNELGDYFGREPTHLIDFGSGQNYLGRALSANPFNKHIIAVEGRPHNIDGARDKDVLAKLKDKPVVRRNKKIFRSGPAVTRSEVRLARIQENNSTYYNHDKKETDFSGTESMLRPDPEPSLDNDMNMANAQHVKVHQSSKGSPHHGSITYVDQRIEGGDLGSVLEKCFPESNGFSEEPRRKRKHSNLSLLTLSIHSCGNLLHHGLRTILNPEVSAVAMIGCCYNLMTERLGPPSYKLPGLQLRSLHPRLEQTSSARDPDGFPMSQHLAEYQSERMDKPGIRLNITARMMAVQAPSNWSRQDSEGFFSRHHFRALLQRIFVDFGVFKPSNDVASDVNEGSSVAIIIGTLPKSCYTSFLAYVRGAVRKITGPNSPSPQFSKAVAEALSPEKLTDEAISEYEEKFEERKHNLAVTWTMMAFSAGVIESVIVVDRWLWLKEQPGVETAWVEPVFDFKQSPRNLVVVGVKRRTNPTEQK